MVVSQTIQNLLAAATGLLVLAGVIVGVSALKTDQYSYKCGTATHIANTTKANCYLAANHSLTSTYNPIYNSAYNITSSVESMSNNFGSQLGTVGIMFGVGLIIAAIAILGFGLMKQK